MTITGTTTDYSGRQVDIELLQSVQQLVSPQRVHVSFTSEPVRITAGVEKLVQRYALLFLSAVEQVHFDTEQGTEFMIGVTAGYATTGGSVNRMFALANIRVRDQLLEEIEDTDTFGANQDDEVFSSAELLDFDVDFQSSTLYLQILITTAAGETIEFLLPVTATR